MSAVAENQQVPSLADLSVGRQRRFFSLDPRTTMLNLLVINVVVLSISDLSVTYLGFLFTVIMLMTIRCWKILGGYITFFAVCQFLHLVVQPAFPNKVVTILITFAFFLSKYVVVFGTGLYFVRTTTAAEFVAAMKKMRISDVLVVPIAVMFRFFPAVYEEFWAVVNAMKLRQLFKNGWEALLHPVKTTEYVVVPLLTSVINIGEDLSASAMVRGLGAPGRKTSIVPLGFQVWDGVVVVASIAFLIFAILTKVQVI